MTDPFSALHAVRDAVRVAAAPPGAATVRARAEHAQRVRRTAIAICAVVALAALGLAGVAGSNLANGPDHRPADPPSPSVTVDESPAPAPPTPEPSVGVGLGIDARSIDLANATIKLPAWPVKTGSTTCAAGDRRFRNGEATLTDAWKYRVVKDAPAVYGNLDDQPGDEILFEVSCASAEGSPALLAARVRADRTLEGLAYLAPAPGVGSFDLYQIDDGEVVVEAHAGPDAEPVAEQIRRYRWRGDRFAQTAGPTRFPTAAEIAKEDVRKVNFRNTWLSVNSGTALDDVCGHAMVTFANGRGRRGGYSGVPAGTLEVGPVSTGFLAGRKRPERAQALITMHCTDDKGAREDAVYALIGDDHVVHLVVGTRSPGVAAIVRHEITSDGVARVTVRLTSGGEQVRTLRLEGDTLVPA